MGWFSWQSHKETSRDALEMLSFPFVACSKKGGSKAGRGELEEQPFLLNRLPPNEGKARSSGAAETVGKYLFFGSWLPAV